MSEWLWPMVTLGAWCFGFASGIAWCAQWRPVRIEINVNREAARDE